MKSATNMKVVGGIVAVGAAAFGTIMLIGKKALNKLEKEKGMMETPLDGTAEETEEAAIDVEESKPDAPVVDHE